MTLALMALTTATAWADSTFSGGNGSQGNPYQIATTADLDQLAADVNSGYKNYYNKYFVLTADITYTHGDSETENNYTAIGSYDMQNKFFMGTFDGQNHTISGIRIYKSGNDNADKFQGLFGQISSNATVKNVILADARITGDRYTGGIAGYNDGTVENCHVLNTVTVHAVQNDAHYHGGIVGFNADHIIGQNTSAATVTNSYYTISTAAASAVGNNDGTVTDCGLAPNDNADNTGFFALMAARTAALNAIDRDPALSTAVDITLSARTLTADNWNTLCVPFALSSAQIESIFGAGTLVKTLSSYTNDGTTVTVTFISADEIVAGTPYIIMPANTVANPEFTGVTIDNTMHDVTAGDATFKGTYSPVLLAANDKKKLFLADNMLWYPNADVTVRACRAYFELDSEVQAREFVLNFGDGEETGIVSMDNGQWIMDNEAGAWYTLDGRKLSQKPIAKGLYINNGKKVVVK